MGAVDPTYPLLPLACIFASVLLLLVLLNSVIRQSWNLGVTFLCFWLFLQNVTESVNTIVWYDNAEIKLFVYCDIGATGVSLNGHVFSLSNSVAHRDVSEHRQTNGDPHYHTSAAYDCQPPVL